MARDATVKRTHASQHRLLFNEGVANVRGALMLGDGELTQCENLIYNKHDPVGLHKMATARQLVGRSLFAANVPSGYSLNSGQAIFWVPFEVGGDLLLYVVELEEKNGKQHWVLFADLDTGSGDKIEEWGYLDDSRIEATQELHFAGVKHLNRFFILAGQLVTDTQRPFYVEGVENGKPVVKEWGRQSGGAYIEEVMTLRGRPFMQTGSERAYPLVTDAAAGDAIFNVTQNKTTDTDDAPTWKHAGYEWMKQGPEAGLTPGLWIIQPAFGHFDRRYRSTDEQSGPYDYTFFVTEYDAENDVESSYPGDINVFQYTPRERYVSIADGRSSSVLGTVPGAGYDRKRPHRIMYGYPPIAGAPGDGDDLVGSFETYSYRYGGVVFGIKLNKANIRPETTHLRLYMSPLKSGWPEGYLVPNEFLYLAFERTDPTTPNKYDEADTVPFDASLPSVFIQLPAHEPGLPVTPMTIDLKADGTVLQLDRTTLATFDGDETWLFVLKPHNVITGALGDAFPLVVVESEGELTSVNPLYAPPPRCDIGANFQNVIVTNDLDNPGTVRWSSAESPHYFPSDFTYKLTDEVTGIVALGRYCFVSTRRGLFIARFLPQTGLNEDTLRESFLEVDATRGAASPKVMVGFTHPLHGPAVAFMGEDGDLWLSGGGQARRAAPQYRVPTQRPGAGILVDNPGAQRLEYHLPATFASALDPDGEESDLIVFFHYAESNLRSDGNMRVTGPHKLYAADTVVGAAASPSKMWAMQAYNGSLLMEAGDARLTLGKVMTAMQQPFGLGIPQLVVEGRYAHGNIREALSHPKTYRLRVLGLQEDSPSSSAYRELKAREGQDTFEHSMMVEAFQVEIQGYGDGRLDMVEFDIDNAGTPRG